jgi:predicted outer membrane protein
MQRARFFFPFACAAALAGCSSTPQGPVETEIVHLDAGSADAAACTSAPLFMLCSDAQILAILAAEFESHVTIANAVRARLGTTALELAEKIITDDSVLGVQVEGEARETGIAATPGGVDREIGAEAQQAIQALAGASTPMLDAAYVDREVLAHLRALALIDRFLAPSVHDPRIGDLLGRVRQLVVEHAQAATQAQIELEGACARQPD